jgi:cysteine desulfuration protein SufE
MPPLADEEKTRETKVEGCASQVWLVSSLAGTVPPTLLLRGDSDAHIVKGRVAIITTAFSGLTPAAALAVDAEALLASLGLDAHLSSQRANGLRAMVRRIKSEAARAQAAA